MSETSSHLLSQLRTVLVDLQSKPYTTVPNPPETARRASVAVIVRINPHYKVLPIQGKTKSHSSSYDLVTRINQFFEQQWVKHGDAEVLFIKRASKKRDPWSGDIALPGGRRDPEDIDDHAAAIRETREEVGLDISKETAINAGSLPQRIVTASWGRKPLMVLCPFIFLLTEHYVPPLTLQPSEVASTHWVPIRALLAPSQRSFALKELSYRLTEYELGIPRALAVLMFGSIKFSAIQLVPSETKVCTTVHEFLNTGTGNSSQLSEPVSNPSSRPLILWGLTFGIIIDFLEMLPPYNALSLWTYPTFTSWDLRLALWMLTFSHRRRMRELLNPERDVRSKSDTRLPQELGSGITDQKLLRSARIRAKTDDKVERSNMEARTLTGSHADEQQSPASQKIDAMLEGYDVPLCWALYLVLVLRVLLLCALVSFLMYSLHIMYEKGSPPK